MDEDDNINSGLKGLNKVLLERVFHRCDLAHWDRFPGEESGRRAFFDIMTVNEFCLIGFSSCGW